MGEILAELRQDKKMLQKELGQRLGVSVATVSAYECNKTTPSDEIKIKIARIFNVSLDYLLGLTKEKIDLDRKNVLILPQPYPVEVREEMLDYARVRNARIAKRRSTK